MLGGVTSGPREATTISLVVVGLEDEGGSMTLFTCSACRGAVSPPSVGGGDRASEESSDCEGREREKPAEESGRWLARIQNGYDDGRYRMSSYPWVEAENAVGAASV